MAPVMAKGLRVYYRCPGWEEDECFLTDQLRRFDSPEAFAAAVWFSLILSEWDSERFLSAGAYSALIEYSQHAAAQGFYPSVVAVMRLLQKSAAFKE
jgi:hypothetical protein